MISVSFFYVFLSLLAYPASGVHYKFSQPAEIVSSQLCPNPIWKARPSNSAKNSSGDEFISGITLDKSWRAYERFLPCTFRGENSSLIQVRSINLNNKPWDFSTASECPNFLKFETMERHLSEFQVVCGREKFDQYVGPYGLPMVLYYRWEQRGLSFPLFFPSYVEHPDGLRGHAANAKPFPYVQVYFSIFKDDEQICRVQQYKVDWFSQGCSKILAANSEASNNCGEYIDCAELERLYGEHMTVFREEGQQLLIWRGSPSSNPQVHTVRHFMRQKMIPILFLVILLCTYKSYLRAGTRLGPETSWRGLSRRNRRRSTHPSASHNGCHCMEDSHVDIEEPTSGSSTSAASGQGSRVPKTKKDDLPPSYDSLSPPAYNDVVTV